MRASPGESLSEQARSELYSRLHYRFENEQLLVQALTHRSQQQAHYERLEFLGDSVLGLVVSEELYRRFPQATEGKLSRMRASLVCGQSLSGISRAMGLGNYVQLGSGELKSGGFDRNSILADILEAIIGAMYLDGHWEPVRSFVLQILLQPLANIHPDTDFRDPKTRLQEALQRQNFPLPTYQVVTTSGQDHCKEFVVVCRLNKAQEYTGRGHSRRHAEQDAAAQALQCRQSGLSDPVLRQDLSAAGVANAKQ